MLSTVAHAGTREFVASACGKHVLGGWDGPSYSMAVLGSFSFHSKTDHHAFVFGKKPGKCAGRANRKVENSLMVISSTPKETPPFFACGKEERGKSNLERSAPSGALHHPVFWRPAATPETVHRMR